MAQKSDLIGLGMPPMLAQIIADGAAAVIATGATRASAAAIGNQNRIAYVVASNSGSGIALPPIGGDQGGNLNPLIGDEYNVVNLLSATILVYAPGTATFVGLGASTEGSAGQSVQPNTNNTFRVLTASTWAVQ